MKAERKKYNLSFDVLDLKSFKRSAPNHGWAYIIFILKDGTTYPAVHFHNGGSKALLKELEKFVHIRRWVFWGFKDEYYAISKCSFLLKTIVLMMDQIYYHIMAWHKISAL